MDPLEAIRVLIDDSVRMHVHAQLLAVCDHIKSVLITADVKPNTLLSTLLNSNDKQTTELIAENIPASQCSHELESVNTYHHTPQLFSAESFLMKSDDSEESCEESCEESYEDPHEYGHISTEESHDNHNGIVELTRSQRLFAIRQLLL